MGTRWIASLLRLVLLAALALGTTAASRADEVDGGHPLDCRVIGEFVRGYLQNHVRYHELDGTLRERTVDTFVRRLDSAHTLLLESEATGARASLRDIFDRIPKGDCTPLFALHEKIVAQHRAAEAYVRKVVGAEGFALDESVEIVLDPDERDVPKTPQDRDALNLRLIHFQLSNYLASGVPFDEARERLIHRYELRSRRAAELEPKDLYAAFVDSFASALDPHSNYLSAEVLEDFRISMSLSLEGIGVALSERDGYAVAERIIPGGAADRHSMLEPKDKIIAVRQGDGEPVSIIDMPLRDAVALIRGPAGSKVGLTILRQGEKTERFDIEIERAKIDLSERAAKLRFEERAVGDRKLKLAVIELTSFYGGDNGGAGRQCTDDMARLLEEVQKEKADGLVLDLSRNGGGVLEHAVAVSGFFIRRGEVVRIANSRGQTQSLWDRDQEVLYAGPMVVHTSRVSASASEILAGALKDYRRAVVTGDDHTFGKGTVQTVSTLPPGLGALKVTTALFFRPGGRSTQNDGVSSDVVIPSLIGHDDFGEKHQDNPLPGQSLAPFRSKEVNADADSPQRWEPVTDEILAALSKRSEKRVAESEAFAEIREKIAEAKESDGRVRIADIIADGNGKPSEPTDEEDEDEPTPQLEEALNVLADLVVALDS